MNVGASVDPDASRSVGSAQADAFQGQRHTSLVVAHGVSGWYHASVMASGGSANNPTSTTADFGIHGETTGRVCSGDRFGNGTPGYASETRPKNVAVDWFIKVK